MFEDFAPTGFYPGKSLLHRLQARTKLLVIGIIVITLLLVNRRPGNYWPFLMVFCLGLTGVLLSGIPPLTFWRKMWWLALTLGLGATPTLFISGPNEAVLISLGPVPLPAALVAGGLISGPLLLLLYLAFSGQRAARLNKANRAGQGKGSRASRRRVRFARPLIIVILAGLATLIIIEPDFTFNRTLPFGPFSITERGLRVFLDIFVVFLALYLLSLLLTFTTTPVALVEGLVLLLKPFRPFGLPVDSFALMTLAAFRFIPTLTQEAEQLLKAQIARGADFSEGSGPFLQRLKNLAMLLVPLVRGVLRRAAEMATALEARGYLAGSTRTLLHETHFRIQDYLVIAGVLLLSLLSLLV